MISPKRIVLAYRKQVAHDFSCLQCNLPEPLAGEIFDWGVKNIPDEYLAADGRQALDDIHVTVKYGIHMTDPFMVRDYLMAQKPVTLRLGKVSLFEAEDHDVVKLDATSPQLHHLNKLVNKNFEVTDTYPVYIPHVTIAYVKKGRGKLYGGREDFVGRKVVLDRTTFSGKDNRKTVLMFPS